VRPAKKDRALCPNCGAYGLTENDHNTGKPTPDKWRCDHIGAMGEQPNYLLTYQAAKEVQVILVNAGYLRLAALFDD
jgi:hypothetical protein